VNHECRNNIVNHRHPAFGGRHSQLASQSFLGIWSQRYSGDCVSGVVDTVINGAHLGYIHAKWIIVNQNREGKTMTKKLLSSLFLISLVSIFSGCNTIEGAGEDLERGGEAIQRESREARD
jgi:entericidin B